MGAARQYGSVQRLYTLRAHDESVSKEDVIFNPALFPELDLKPGDIVAVVAVKDNKSSSAEKSSENGDDRGSSIAESRESWPGRRAGPAPTVYDETGKHLSIAKEPDKSRTFVFVVPDDSAQPKKHQDVGLSISSTIANIFGIKNRAQVLISAADEASHAATHVEIVFREQYLSRADMWRLATAKLSQKAIHKDQKLVFLDTIKATVKTIYQNGEKRKAGFFGSSTKTIFRSESARYIIFIQMSIEMWQFDVEGGGEIMFNKVINGFLPELFKNWTLIRAKHRISFVLFSRVEYDDGDSQEFSTLDGEQGYRAGSKDFFRVVTTDVSSGDWVTILQQLKREFRHFLRDITLQKSGEVNMFARAATADDSEPLTDYMIVGRPTVATKGNILEAINLALIQFSGDYIDRDLSRTGISVMIITAGSGLFEVDYTLLKHTTETLIGSGIGIDLVCLAPMPLHSVPLFKYRNPWVRDNTSPLHHTNPSSMENTPRPLAFTANEIDSTLQQTKTNTSTYDPELTTGDWSYAVPHWVDVSFWKGPIADFGSQAQDLVAHPRPDSQRPAHAFALRCVLYELEMMGFMENEMTNIAIPLMHEHPIHPWQKLRHRISGRPKDQIDRPGIKLLDENWMDEYDDGVFKVADRVYDHESATKRWFNKGLAARKISMRSIDDSKGRSVTVRNHIAADDASSTVSKKTVGQISPRRAPSIVSLVTNNENASVMTKSSALARKISYTSSSVAAPQETKAQGRAEASLAKFVSHQDGSKTQMAPSYYNAFRAMFAKSTTPKPSQEAVRSAPAQNQAGTRAITSNSDEEKPTEPINIGSLTSSREAHHSRSPSTDERSASVETLKAEMPSLKKHSLPQSARVDDGGAILYVASNTKRSSQKPTLSMSADAYKPSNTSSPLRGIAPWLVLVNPSNPYKNPTSLDNRFRRWHHIFPKPLKLSVMKWKSLSSPASVPLTNDFFPTAQQLADDYHESTYTIMRTVDDDHVEEDSIAGSKEPLMRELIAFRLAKGFQLVVGPALAEFLGTPGIEYANIFDNNYMARNGATVFLSLGNIIHQLLYLTAGEVEVRRFQRKPVSDLIALEDPTALRYKPYVRPALSSTYETRDLNLSKHVSEYNWNYVDSYLAGYHDDGLSEKLRFWRARFVFIPVELPSSHRKPLPMLTEDSEEEIRLEGIRKLTTMWQKHRVQTVEEHGFSSSRQRQDRNPLMIDYQTRDPSAIVAAGSSGLLLGEAEAKTSLFSDTERYSTKNIDLQKLAQDLQGEKGITMLDRRWHWKMYQNCFVAFDLVSWLLDRFRDIDSRNDAIEFGKELMSKGLFQHVSSKHEFRDGNFFFHISSEYRLLRQDLRGWFGSRRGQASVPSTPLPDAFRPSQHMDTPRIQPQAQAQSNTSSETSLVQETSNSKELPRKKVILSHVMEFNVDPKGQSYRPEIINLHYDRLHSPDNCYHFRIDWMNTTAKFIEDAINLWASHGRKFGLKLVEVPLGEAATVSENLPFRGPFIVRLAVPPPTVLPQGDHEVAYHSSKDSPFNRHIYHKAILRKLNFVLDVEAATMFPADVEVIYSWGQYNYRMTQYVHRSGTTIAQITADGHFQLLANRLYNNRSFEAREPSRVDRRDFSELRNGMKRFNGSPSGSPSLRPVPEGTAEPDYKTITAEEVKEEVEAFCSNPKALQMLYEDLKRPIASPSPAMASTILNTPVPTLRLPPKVTKETNSSPLMMAPFK